MAEVTVGNEESFDSLLKRFNRKVVQDGILTELRRGEHYEKPSIKRKRKKAAKKRSTAKAAKTVTR
ncbi:30S ribosomal protein S21 [Chloroflexota bacterium]